MSISTDCRDIYGSHFYQLQPVDGKLDGATCKLALMKSNLSTETLGRIWDLSDIDCDGFLDKEEFILAMHLAKSCVDGDLLPDSLPPSLIPVGKEPYLLKRAFHPASSSDPFAPISSPANWALIPAIMPPDQSHVVLSPSLGSLSPQMHSIIPYINPLVPTYPPWAILADELNKSDKIFATIDLDADGLVSGMETRDVLLRSGLHQSLLAQLWDLVDIHQSGYLNNEQFAVTLHLITQLLSGSPYTRALPQYLPPELFPPSLRPTAPDQGSFDESNRLIAEIDKIVRERATVEADCTALSSEIQRRATDASNLQRRLDTLNHTSRSLVTQRTEADRRLSTYAQERDILQSHLIDLQSHVARERQKVEDVRAEINNQQLSAKSQEESINSLRNELNELIREESSLQDRMSESRRRLEAVKTESQTTQLGIEKTTNQMHGLESTRCQLRQVLDQYTTLLNGDSPITESDESVVTQLLSTCSANLMDGSSPAYVSTLPKKSVNNALDSLDWTSALSSRITGGGACSVPLDVMSDSRISFIQPTSNPSVERKQTTSAMGWPITNNLDRFSTNGGNFNHQSEGASNAPFDVMSDSRVSSQPNNQTTSAIGWPVTNSLDLFNPGGGGVRSVTMYNHQDQKEDPFGQPALLSTSDFFRDSDLFGGDPFATPVSNHPHDAQASAFDPFSTCSNPITPQLTGADFDAVFGHPNVNENLHDSFGDDPFSSIQQKADSDQTILAKKSPPPRPKLPVNVGKPGSDQKELSGKLDLYASIHHRRKLGSLPNFTDSLNNSKANISSSHTATSGHGTGKLHLLSKVRHAAASSHRSRKESTPGRYHSNSLKHVPEWAAGNLSEEQQLSIATMESERLAQIEERARLQEAAELELALKLSKMESSASS